MKSFLKKFISTFLKHLSFVMLLQNTGMIATGCKTMKLLEEKSGSYLRNHGIQNTVVSSRSMCRIMCYLHDMCLSFNFHQSTSNCEINDSDEFQHPEDLIQIPGYLYRGTVNDCKSHNCPDNSTCQAKFTKEGGFSCICPKGYTGANCEADLDECTTGLHTCAIYQKCVNTLASFYCISAGVFENPVKSCKQILDAGDSKGTGHYWLDPENTGSPFQAFCDMTTDGGGWTVVRRLVQPNNARPAALLVETYDVIKQYNRTDVNIVPRGAAMLDIKNKMGFHQIHFYCRKVNVGRVVSIMTKTNTAGQAVVNFFTSPGGASRPTACGSFDILPDDTSVLSRNCNRWGASSENKWGASCCVGPSRIVAMVAHIGSTNGFEISMFYSCDNTVPSNGGQAVPPDAGDIWQISVR